MPANILDLMRPTDFAALDGIALAQLLAHGEVSQREILDAVRAACAAVNPQLNAVLELYDEPSVAPGIMHSQAGLAGRLAGVPLLRKDLGATEAGRLQECGSRLLRGRRTAHDSGFVSLCRRAGLIFVGRSATPEFGFSSSTESLLNGITRNPWNPGVMAGGSSGGAAAAVAAGIVPVAHASDGGGSIRIPAAACGVIGLKPSRGRVSQGPGGADALLGLACEFVVTRSIRDAAAALDILAQPLPGDPFLLWTPGASYAELAQSAPAPLRIAVATDRWSAYSVDPEIAAAVARAARCCEVLGHRVAWAAPHIDGEAVLQVLTDFFAFGIADLGAVAGRMGRSLGADVLECVTLANWELSQQLTAARLDADLQAANALRRSVGAFFERYDVLLTPALANAPPPHGRYSQSRTDLDPLGFMRELQHTDQFLPVFNITGQPALSIPLGLSRRGLPMGLQIVSRVAHEHVALALGRQLLEAMPRPTTPPVWAGHGTISAVAAPSDP